MGHDKHFGENDRNKPFYLYSGIAFPKEGKAEKSFSDDGGNRKWIGDIVNFRNYFGSNFTAILRARNSKRGFWYPPEQICFSHELNADDFKALGVPHFFAPINWSTTFLDTVKYATSFLPNLAISNNFILRHVKKLIKQGIDPQEIVFLAYSPTLAFTYPCYLAKKKFGCKYIELLDAGPVFRDKGWLRAQILKVFEKHDGVITYVGQAASDFAPDKPYLEIFYAVNPEIAEIYKQNKDNRKTSNKPIIAYTGYLADLYHIDKVLEVIRKTGNKYKWKIAGSGLLASEFETLRQALNQEGGKLYDIEYYGAVSNIEAARIQASADLLLCLKGGDKNEYLRYATKYAASGKLTEYIASGTPVLASDIPAFSSQVKPFVSLLDPNATTDDLIIKLEDIFCDAKYIECMQKAKRGQEFALLNFSTELQNKRIIEFIEKIVSSS